ncbi:hypothetical protein V1282_000274 [Nitrobacteraceae bacterium AZCC 2146]
MAALDAFLTAIFSNVMAADEPDSWAGLMTSALAGAAAALAVAIALTVYFRTGYRSSRDIVRHGVATLTVLGLLAFVAYDMRHTALGYLGINPAKPAVEFEIRLPDAVALKVNARATQIELHTDRNQTLAEVSDGPTFTRTGESILRGSVPLTFRTAQRVVILNLPGQPPLQFKLRLAPSPSQSAEFGPWHLADQGAAPGTNDKHRAPDDNYAIRYRVI